MLLAIISIIDIIAAILIIFPGIFSSIVFYVAVLMLIKALSSLLGGLLAKDFIIILGLIDLLAGLMLLFNFSIPWFWLIILLKGVYSFIVGVLAR
jgi:hypothetical protein